MNSMSVVGGSGLVGKRLLAELGGRGPVKAWLRRPMALPWRMWKDEISP